MKEGRGREDQARNFNKKENHFNSTLQLCSRVCELIMGTWENHAEKRGWGIIFNSKR